MSTSRAGVLLVVAIASLALLAGWYQFWLVCDDAYIDFRYVSNAQKGLGYVWNAPPWRPVEGYTSLLWVEILDWTWRLSGVRPPEAAPLLSLALSAGTLLILVGMVLDMPMSERLAPWRTAVLGAVLFATLSNRAFLAWTSGGLETPLFTLVLLAWVAVATSSASTALLGGLAAVMCLVRPDGLLFMAATLGILAVRRKIDGDRSLGSALWVVVPLGHLAWRRWFYGYWLPNTYYAKHIGPWPVAGVGYFTSFVLEYFYWVFLVVAALAAWRWRPDWQDPRRSRWIGVAAVVAHWAYYTFDVGGDHFEYRVYHHLVPLVAIACFALCDGLGASARRTFAVFATMTAFGLVIPWTHWAMTHTATSPRDKGSFKYPIARLFPYPFRPYVAVWDRIQGRLIGRFVGIRHQGHKTYAAFQAERFPSREVGETISGDGLAMFAHTSIGYPAWTLPNVAILDERGLNDLVVARTKPIHSGQFDRAMAHDHLAPGAYVTCFHPNVRVGKTGKVHVARRARPLTAADVRRCETEWLDRVSRPDDKAAE